MDLYGETFATWNKIASLYEEKFMHLDIYNETYEIFCAALPNDRARLLELGCGPGNITKYLLGQHPNYRIDATDISPAMIELATKNNPSANCFVLDSRDIHKLDKRYDGIICGFCLPYLSDEDVAKMIAGASGLLKSGGMIYLSFVEGEPEKSDFKVSNHGRVFFHYHTLARISELLTDNGFEHPETAKVQYGKSPDPELHTIVISRKSS